LTVTVLFTGYVGLLHSSLGHSLELVFSLTGSEASHLMAQVLFLGSIVMAISQILARLALRNNFKLTLFIGLTLLSVGAIVLAFMDQERELWLAISFISAGVALIQPGHLALVHTLFPTEKLGKEIGILSSGNTIGYAFGGGLAA